MINRSKWFYLTQSGQSSWSGSALLPVEPGIEFVVVEKVSVTQALPAALSGSSGGNNDAEFFFGGTPGTYLEPTRMTQTGLTVEVIASVQDNGVHLGASDAPVIATISYSLIPSVSPPSKLNSGLASGSLYALWLANGKPERIGYAATGGYVDSGARQVAAGSAACAGGAMWLHEVDGRLMGRWCGVEGLALAPAVTRRAFQVATFNNANVPGLAFDGWVSNTLSVPVNVWILWWPRNGSSGTFYRVMVAGSSPVSQIYPDGTADWTSPGLPPGQGVQISDVVKKAIAQNRWPSGVWNGEVWFNVAGVSEQSLLTYDFPSLASEINLSGLGAPWTTASVWSKAGEWIRRKAWTDSQMMIRHEAGPGSTRAVAVLKSSTVTTPRAVKKSEFGAAEFSALDWVMKYPVSGDIDLTDAVIAVDAVRWLLWKRAAAVTTPGQNPTDPSGQGCDLTLTPYLVQAISPWIDHYAAQKNRASLVNAGVMLEMIVNAGVESAIHAGGRASCAEYYAGLIRNGFGGGTGGTGGTGGSGTLPATGEGFLYLKNGVQTLVPARDESGANWSP